MYYSDTNKTFSTSTWSTSLPYSQKTAAGTYTLYYYCYVSDVANNTGSGINTVKSISATISNANGSGTITMSGWTYGGTVTNPTVTSNPNNASVSYTWYNSSKTQLSSKPGSTSTAGTYYVKATFGAVTNYNAYTTDYVSFTIAKANGSVSVSRKTPTYTGSALNIATATATGTYYLGIGSSSSSAPSSWTKNAALTATTPGTYYVWAKCDAGTNHNAVTQYYVGTATISNADFNVSAPNQTYEYTGSAQGAAISVSGLKGNQTATIMYGTTSGSYTTSDVQTLTSPGSKTIYWKVTAPYHNDKTGSYVITINKIQTTITYTQSDITEYAINSTSKLNVVKAVTLARPTLSNGAIIPFVYNILSATMSTGANASSYFAENDTVLSMSANTPVASYTITMEVSVPTTSIYMADPVTSTFKVTVNPDEQIYVGTLSINSSAQLPAGAATRTITWGNIARKWKYGGNPIGLVSGTASLSISCSNTTVKSFMSLSKTSYTNATTATTATLTKTTYGTTPVSSSTVTINLSIGGNLAGTLVLNVAENTVTDTLTGVSLSYNTASSSSGATNTPTVKFSTSYECDSGATGSRSNITSLSGATFTKTFTKVATNSAASLDTSTGVVTWNTANTGTAARSMTVKCNGTLVSNGITSTATSPTVTVSQSAPASTTPIESYIGNVVCDTDNFSGVVNSGWAATMVFSRAIPSSWVGTTIRFYAYNSSKVQIPHPGGGATFAWTVTLTSDLSTGSPRTIQIANGQYSSLGGTATNKAAYIKIIGTSNSSVPFSGSYIGVSNV